MSKIRFSRVARFVARPALVTRARRVAPIVAALALALGVGLGGCVATTRSLDPEVEKHYDASYDFSDKKAIVDELTSSLRASPNVPRSATKPVVVIYGVANKTSEHIDTSGITDDIRNALLNAGDFTFVNRPQRDNLIAEADYQYAGFVSPEQRVAEGRQVGAQYVLSGTLRSIEKRQPSQWRLNKKKLVYYSMNLELTDLQSSVIVWADSVEIARESSQPILRW